MNCVHAPGCTRVRAVHHHTRRSVRAGRSGGAISYALSPIPSRNRRDRIVDRPLVVPHHRSSTDGDEQPQRRASTMCVFPVSRNGILRAGRLCALAGVVFSATTCANSTTGPSSGTLTLAGTVTAYAVFAPLPVANATMRSSVRAPARLDSQTRVARTHSRGS
jgi:hypothetical protein